MDWVQLFDDNSVDYVDSKEVKLKFYTHNGLTLGAKEWAVALGISRDAFYQRIEDLSDPDKIFVRGFLRKSKRLNQKHGASRSRSYDSWNDMINRCQPQHRKKHRYYDRGIKVCKRWESFANFLVDMGERPLGTTLDRENNDKGYNPKNCRWATPKQQGRNTSYNKILIYRGKRFAAVELAEYLGINYGLLRVRLHRGIPLERAISKAHLRTGRVL